MKIEQLAIQLYTLREHCQNAADYATTLKKVRQIGYESIQISGTGDIPVADLRSIAESEGLTICATHESADLIRESPSQVVERLGALGCRYTAYPYPAGVDFSRRSDIDTLIADLDAAGAVLRQAGQVLCYHNHAHELYRLDGTTVLDLIYDGTAAENLQGELDTYWVQAGGSCPVAWCEKLANRLPLLHLKDFAVTPEGKPFFAEIGSGNLDFPKIISAAEKSGCEWFIVEQDTCPGDPFDSIAKSFHYAKEHLVS